MYVYRTLVIDKGIELDPTELALWVEARSLQVDVWRAYVRGV